MTGNLSTSRSLGERWLAFCVALLVGALVLSVVGALVVAILPVALIVATITLAGIAVRRWWVGRDELW